MIKRKLLISFISMMVLFTAINLVKADTLPDDGGRISSVSVIQTKTGTGPWDADDTPGNDSSEDNNIVRSFDQVTWTLENTFVINNSSAVNYSGGKIYFEATLPNTLDSQTAAWDTKSMRWVENAKVSSDGRTLTGYYSLSEDTVTIPGKQTLVFVANIFGASNGTTFQPTIKTWLNGNSQDEYVVTVPDLVTVSAVPRYNVLLTRNGNLSNKVTVDYGEGNTLGRMYGYAIMIDLYNPTVSKGLKGIEYPKGPITMDIDLLLERTEFGSTARTNITSECTPVLWDYKTNNLNNTGTLKRNMYFTNGYSRYHSSLPLGVKHNERRYSVFDSGTITMTQNGSKLSYTVEDYKMDGTFPIWTYGYGNTVDRSINYTENYGIFSIGYFEIFVPDNEASTIEDRNYYLTLTENNFKTTSASGQVVTTQMITTDDVNTVEHVLYKKGSYSQDIWPTVFENGANIGSIANRADGSIALGQKFEIMTKSGVGVTNDFDPLSESKFVKFDGDAFEPIYYTNGTEYRLASFNGSMRFNLFYVTKKDGTNWTSFNEMRDANIENMVVYDRIEDIPEGDICVGVFYESTGGNLARTTGDNNCTYFPLRVKDNANVGQTYGFVQRTKLWQESLDRSVYTITNPDAVYPKTIYDPGNLKYVKIEYDANGKQVSGTNSGGSLYGTSILVIAGNLKLSKESIDANGKAKVNYDISKNEYDVTYRLTPVLTSPVDLAVPITGVSVRVTDTLTQNLRYVPGSSNYGDPEITNNSDGTQTLVWYVNNCTIGEKIEPITYVAHIDEDTPNGTQIDTTAVAIGDESKIGVTAERYRTASNTIQVINLSSHRLYKTVETPVIERNGQIKYTISYKNNTDEKVMHFQLLDVLPYNGDGRDSNFNGSYIVEKIVVKNQMNSALELYYTSDESARNESCDNEDLTNGWTKATSENINTKVTAFALKGIVLGQEALDIEIYLKTDGNKGLDKYVNNATVRVYLDTEKMITSNVTAQTILRQLDGKVWYDKNANGIIDADESFAKDVVMTLTDENRNQVKDINGNFIPSVKTDANGYYKFDDLPKGKYLVNVTLNGQDYILTQKEVGINATVNSKFNESTKETDLITRLDTVDLPELTVANVNAGLVKKPTKVIVNYKEKGTETILNPQIIIDGRIDDEYETENKLTIINKVNDNKYEFVETTGAQTSGTMVEDTLEVTYWYQKKMAEVETNYLEVGTNKVLSTKVTTQDRVDADYSTVNKLDAINAANGNIYEFVETTGDAVNGKYTLDKKVITYWYQKKMAEIEVNYLEKGTNAVLAEQETGSDRIDESYTTVNKLDEINAANDNKYEFVEITGATASGTYKVDKQVINYWYQKKAAKVNVKYVDVNTNEEIYKEANITGKVDDEYATVNELDNINKENSNKYEFVRDTQNTSGNMTIDQINVVYYYQKKATNVIVKYVDADSNDEIYAQAEITGRIDDNYSTVNELDNINKNWDNKYAFVRVTDNASGKMTADTIEVTYYYQKKEAEVEVNYLEVGTENVLADQEIKGGKVDGAYTTENKLDEINAANGNKYEFVETTGAAVKGTLTLEKQVVNYWYQKKAANVIVKYKEVGTEKVLSEQVEFTGRVDDKYTSVNKLDEINAANANKYEFVNVDGKAEGNMTLDTKYITYWYQKKSTQVITKYIDKDSGEEIYLKDTQTGRVDDAYTTVNELDNINKKYSNIYEFVEATPNTEGNMTIDTINVVYYYQKKIGEIEVNYLEYGTNKVLASQETSSAKIDQPYTTVDKINEINDTYYNSYEYVNVTGNTTGTYKLEKQVINYYYTKKGTKVITNYVDMDTNESIYDVSVQEGKVDDTYTTVNELDNINARHNNKYEFVKATDNTSGNMTVDTIYVTYYYTKKIGEVEVLYKEVGTEEILAETVSMTGKVDSEYSTQNKLDTINNTYENKYEFVEVEGKEVGVFELEKQTTTYWYQKKETNVIVNYVDIETDEKLSEEVEITGRVDDEYTTEDKIESINEEYNPYVYELVEISGETEGNMVLDTTYVTYYYAKKKVTVVVEHVDEYGNILGEESFEVVVGDELESGPEVFEGYYCEEERRIDEITGEETIVYHYYKIEQVDTSDMSFALILVVAICSFYGIKKVKFSKNK